MKIALIGFGKMGHTVQKAAIEGGHTIVCAVDPFAPDATVQVKTAVEAAEVVAKSGAEGIIEFSHPSAVFENITALIPLKIPMVVGTTGWFEKTDEVKRQAEEFGSHLLTSPNFSIGVNLFYRLVSEAVSLFNGFDEYDCAVWEAHHNQKADSPSGTALEIARRILEKSSVKKTPVYDAFHQQPKPEELHVSSTRYGHVPGTHTVFFDSRADTIEVTHTARSRDGFATGSVRALEWLVQGVAEKQLQPGMYSFDDVLNSI